MDSPILGGAEGEMGVWLVLSMACVFIIGAFRG